MYQAITVLAETRTAEPWTVPSVIAGLLLFFGLVMLIVGLFVGSRR